MRVSRYGDRSESRLSANTSFLLACERWPREIPIVSGSGGSPWMLTRAFAEYEAEIWTTFSHKLCVH